MSDPATPPSSMRGPVAARSGDAGARMSAGAHGACPICGGDLHGWISLAAPESEATVGMLIPDEGRLIDRCGDCDAGIERGVEVDGAAELERAAIREGGTLVALRAPNRASLQAGIGGEGWAALVEWTGPVLHTKRSLSLLARDREVAVTEPACPPWGRNQRWMWETLINGLTFRPNHLRLARQGRLRPSGGAERAKYAVDWIVTVLGAPFAAVFSLPIELIAALLGRGGDLYARVERPDRL